MARKVTFSNGTCLLNKIMTAWFMQELNR